jgi:hypothetical protein
MSKDKRRKRPPVQHDGDPDRLLVWDQERDCGEGNEAAGEKEGENDTCSAGASKQPDRKCDVQWSADQLKAIDASADHVPQAGKDPDQAHHDNGANNGLKQHRARLRTPAFSAR